MTIPEGTLDSLSSSESPPPTTHSWRPLVARLHFYAGVLVAPLLIVAAVTGGLYALAPTLERVVYRDVLSVEARGDSLPLPEQVAAAQQSFPGLTVTGLRPPATPSESTRVYLADPALGDDEMRAAFVDPHTGRVLGDEVTWLGYLPLSTWLDGLHRHLNLGEPGRVYSEAAASWLWVVALGGLYLWLVKAAGNRRRGRRTNLVTVDGSVTGRARTLNWHGATGMWLLAGLLFLSATGITWSTYAGAHVSDIRTALNWQRPQLDTADSEAHTGHRPLGTGIAPSAVDYAGVLDTAAAAGVHSPVEMRLPADSESALTVTEVDKPYRLTTNAVALDPGDLAVTDRVDYWRDYSVIAKLADWGIRAHMGSLAGLVNQVVLLCIAVGLLTVIVRGYRMWWQRRPTRGSAWAVGRAPLRSGLRRLHPVAIGAVLVTAVGLGWFLPVFGFTLAAFVATDLAVAAARRFRLDTPNNQEDHHA